MSSRRSLWACALALAAGVGAQDDPLAAIESDLAGGDRVAVEAARRRLASFERDRLPVELLRRLMRHADGFRVRASASLLVAAGLLGAEDRALALAHVDPGVRTIALDGLDRSSLLAVALNDPEPSVQRAAFERLVDAGVADEDAWIAALRAPGDEVAEAAAAYVVYELAPFPTRSVRRLEGDARAVRRLLTALADRPRPGAEPWLRELLAEAGLETDDRLRAYAALAGDAIELSFAKDMLAVLASDQPELHRLAVRALDRLSAAVADRLVAEVHRLAAAGAPLERLLGGLDRISRRGERHMLALARALTDVQRHAIVEWLSLRQSPELGAIVAEALDGDYPLTAGLLRLAGSSLTTDARRRRAIALLDDDRLEFRIAAFHALVASGRYEPELTEFALKDPNEVTTRVRILLELPREQIPHDAWLSLLDVGETAALRLALGYLEGGVVPEKLEPKLRELARSGAVIGHYAAQLCLARGRSEFARSLWDDFDDGQRRAYVTALESRREPWVLARVRDLEMGAYDYDIAYTRLRLGDRGALRTILQNADLWPAKWLQRCEKPAARMLTAAELETIERRLLGPEPLEDAARRRALLGWVTPRADLGVATILQRLLADDPDEEVRYLARRGLMARANTRAVFAAALESRIGRRLSDDEIEQLYEILGALEPPLSRRETDMLARFLLVGPLGDPRAEIEAHLAARPDRALHDTAILNLAANTIREHPPEGGSEAFAAAADAARAHENSYALGRRRLGRLLVVFCRDEQTRRSIGPSIARLTLDAPDLDSTYLGPACLVLAEDAERREDHAAAADLYLRSLRGFLRSSPPPLIERAILGETYVAAGELPLAGIAARHHMSLARARHSRGDDDSAREAMTLAAELAVGDDAAVEDYRKLEQEIMR